MLQGNEGTGATAKFLRRSTSLPEGLLWQRLRSKPEGLKFRRQHPAGPYVVDFYCHEARLIIEIDGIAHAMGDRPFTDEERDAWFREREIEVIRIPAGDVLANPGTVAQSIVTHCAAKAVDRTQ